MQSVRKSIAEERPAGNHQADDDDDVGGDGDGCGNDDDGDDDVSTPHDQHHDHNRHRRRRRRLPQLRHFNRNNHRKQQKKIPPRRRGSSFLVYKTFNDDNIMNPNRNKSKSTSPSTGGKSNGAINISSNNSKESRIIADADVATTTTSDYGDDDIDNDDNGEKNDLLTGEHSTTSSPSPSSYYHRASVVVILLGFLTAVGVGSIVGIVPQIASQRYMELMIIRKSDDSLLLQLEDPPNGSQQELQQQQQQQQQLHDSMYQVGAEKAQSVASLAAFGRYSIALLTNALLGSWSDTYGRKPIQLLGLILLSLSPLMLIAVQLLPALSPTWYFGISSLESVVNFMSIGFIQLTDVIDEPKHRSVAYGLFFGAFMGGIAVAPFLATFLSHLVVSIVSFVIRVSCVLIAMIYLPETLLESKRRIILRRQSELSIVKPHHDTHSHEETDHHDHHDDESIMTKQQKHKPSMNRHDERRHPASWIRSTIIVLGKPFQEMSILLRNYQLILISIGAFTSKAVFSADVTLFFFYVERELGVKDQDVAQMMFVTGCFGVLMQAVLLKYLISCLGEHMLLRCSFLAGLVHNLIYGLSRNKWQLYAGLCLSQLTNTNGPLLSALASRSDGVKDTEQGRIQGALFSLTSVAEAVGPLLFNFVFHHWTVRLLGAGTMFGFGSVLYGVGLLAVSVVRLKKKSLDNLQASSMSEEELDDVESTGTNGTNEESPLVSLKT